mgnify:CR=1 FL=1
MPDSKPWGGRRKGAGRDPTYDEPMQRKTISVPASHVEHLKRVGDGNISKGVRRLVKKDIGEEP